MSPVKRQKLPSTVAGRIAHVRQILGSPDDGKALTQKQLHARLRKRFGEEAPSLSTVKRWEQAKYGEIQSDHAEQLAAIAGCAPEWILYGHGQAPQEGPEMGPSRPAKPRSAAELITVVRRHGSEALARVLEEALERDEVAGNVRALKDFRRFIYEMVTGLEAKGYKETARGFWHVYHVLTEQLDELQGGDKSA